MNASVRVGFRAERLEGDKIITAIWLVAGEANTCANRPNHPPNATHHNIIYVFQ